jgi:serine O-acetyltransferase
MSERSASFDLTSVVAQLAHERQRWRQRQQRSTEPGGRELPSPQVMAHIIDGLRGVLFPMRLGPSDLRQESEDFYVGHTLDSVLQSLFEQAKLELTHAHRDEPTQALATRAHDLVRAFAHSLPQVRALLDSDVTAAFEGDPAASSVDEVLLCYPGIEAMIHHRLAHRLYGLGVPLLARLVSERAHALTGIDIHPGADIGPGFFIDHGTGVVIGETSVIGQRVRIYQAVTLGAKSFPLDDQGHVVKGLARHPIVEDEVVIYAGATVLGRITIGKGASIGGNVWVTHDVPPGAQLRQAQAQRDDALVMI